MRHALLLAVFLLHADPLAAQEPDSVVRAVAPADSARPLPGPAAVTLVSAGMGLLTGFGVASFVCAQVECDLAVVLVGWAGFTAGVPIGAFLANQNHGSLLAALGGSIALGALGIAAGSQFDAQELVLFVPLAQLIASVAIILSTDPRR